MSFSDVVESLKSLSLAEKEEIQTLLAQYLREERRDEIYQNYLEYISLDFATIFLVNQIDYN